MKIIIDDETGEDLGYLYQTLVKVFNELCYQFVNQGEETIETFKLMRTNICLIVELMEALHKGEGNKND